MMNNLNQLRKKLLSFLDEMHAIDILCVDVSLHTSITDEMIICSGRSSKHVQSIAIAVSEKMKHSGIPAISRTGIETGEWALLDFGDIIVHIMQPTARAFYNLEGLWQKDKEQNA